MITNAAHLCMQPTLVQLEPSWHSIQLSALVAFASERLDITLLFQYLLDALFCVFAGPRAGLSIHSIFRSLRNLERDEALQTLRTVWNVRRCSILASIHTSLSSARLCAASIGWLGWHRGMIPIFWHQEDVVYGAFPARTIVRCSPLMLGRN